MKVWLNTNARGWFIWINVPASTATYNKNKIVFLHEAHKWDVVKVKVLGKIYDVSGQIGKPRSRWKLHVKIHLKKVAYVYVTHSTGWGQKDGGNSWPW